MTERIVQLEIFPEARHVEAVDPRVAIGPDTRVSALFRVRYGETPQVHQVYHDRHGWYCAEHGPRCSAVRDAAGCGLVPNGLRQHRRHPSAHIAAAAAELDSRFPTARTGVLGAPTVFRYERWVDGELSRDGIGELFDIARREVGLQGTVSEAFDTIEWRAAGQMGLTIVSIVRRSGRTRITVSISRGNAAAMVASASAAAGGVAAMAIGSSLMVTGAAPLAVVAVAAVSLTWGGAGGWLAMRGIWRRIAGTWAPRAQALGAELVAVAQQAIDAARKHSE